MSPENAIQDQYDAADAAMREAEKEPPIFIPLKRKYFEQFERGEKTIEYRAHGGRWTGKHCRVGRKVTLSLGYGKTRRLSGTITSFEVDFLTDKIPGWEEVYGKDRNAVAACIGIKLDPR